MWNTAFVLAGSFQEPQSGGITANQEVNSRRAEEGDLRDANKGKGDSLIQQDKGRVKDGTAGSFGQMGMREFCWNALTHRSPNFHAAVCTSGLSCPYRPLTRARTLIRALLLSKNDWQRKAKESEVCLSVDSRKCSNQVPISCGASGTLHCQRGVSLHWNSFGKWERNRARRWEQLGALKHPHIWKIYGGFGEVRGDKPRMFFHRRRRRNRSLRVSVDCAEARAQCRCSAFFPFPSYNDGNEIPVKLKGADFY